MAYIGAQYSTSREPQQNGLAENAYRTIIDMLRSMISYSALPINLWMDALNAAIHNLSQVPSKVSA
jgi:hypothetical protein